jgi:hypothetical protein
MFCQRVHGAGGSDEVSSAFIILGWSASSTYVKRLRSSSLLARPNSDVTCCGIPYFSARLQRNQYNDGDIEYLSAD